MGYRKYRGQKLAQALSGAWATASVDPQHAAEDKQDFEKIKGIVDNLEQRDKDDASAVSPDKRPDVSQSDREAADKKYGSDADYADPKNHKYPLNTAGHVKAAWSYIPWRRTRPFTRAASSAPSRLASRRPRRSSAST